MPKLVPKIVVASAIWVGVAIAIAVPIGAAAMGPLLEWRDPVYIAAGFAGVLAMALLLLQPLLAAGHLPGFAVPTGRRIHRWVGSLLFLTVVIHVAALWVTSPPDVVDALLFASPTPFSVWGVIAMWCVFATAVLAATRRKFRLQPRTWRISHKTLAAVIVTGSVIHAMLIEGTMETVQGCVMCPGINRYFACAGWVVTAKVIIYIAY